MKRRTKENPYGLTQRQLAAENGKPKRKRAKAARYDKPDTLVTVIDVCCVCEREIDRDKGTGHKRGCRMKPGRAVTSRARMDAKVKRRRHIEFVQSDRTKKARRSR